ncbi:MAG: CotH kinase family protein, partial [Planctomycetes bacterium]|nr:CotH kinase family protein [Planctomycetota bacterium]
RKAARAWLADNRPQRGRMGRGGPPGMEFEAGDNTAEQPGARVAPKDVSGYPDRGLFDVDVVRTIFLDFDSDDWLAELTAFYHTDVTVPARVTLDGTTCEQVGAAFRGNTSFMMARGKRKSFDLNFDERIPKQNLFGVRNLDLLNCNTDPSFVREALHAFVANQYFPAPRVALMRVVVNGEDLGVYAAVQQFDKDYLEDHHGTKKGARFKVPPDFSGRGGLMWLGDDAAAYQRSYQLKSDADADAWQALVDVCAVLENTPTDRLQAIVPQHLDVEATLWFLALDNALADDDGYASRGSDYLLWRDPSGRFHPIPRDNNEVLLGERGPGGPGGPGGRRPRGGELPGGADGGG